MRWLAAVLVAGFTALSAASAAQPPEDDPAPADEPAAEVDAVDLDERMHRSMQIWEYRTPEGGDCRSNYWYLRNLLYPGGGRPDDRRGLESLIRDYRQWLAQNCTGGGRLAAEFDEAGGADQGADDQSSGDQGENDPGR